MSTLSYIPFALLSLSAIYGAIMVMSARNVVHAAFWLLELSVASAGLIWFLGAEFIAIMQLMVYAGAVSVLVIFTIMITLRSRADAERSADFSWGGVIAAAAFYLVVGYGIFTTVPADITEPSGPSTALVDFGTKMFTLDGWVLPFEVASLVLTVALIAGVLWTRDGDR